MGAETAGSSQRHPPRAGDALQGNAISRWFYLDASETPNGLEMSRPASQPSFAYFVTSGWPGRLHRVVGRRKPEDSAFRAFLRVWAAGLPRVTPIT